MRESRIRCRALPLLFLASMGGITVATTAAAQSESTPAGSARAGDLEALVRTGIMAYRTGDFATARGALLTAVKLSPEASFIEMLADTEMKLGKFREAAAHWSQYLAVIPPEHAKERTEAAEQLAVCRTHLGRVKVISVPSGAAVLVDGVPTGETPQSEIWIEPGAHTFQAKSADGASERVNVTVQAGEEASVSLPVEVSPPNAAAASVATTQSSRSTASGGSVQGMTSQPESNAQLYVLIGGAALTAVATGIGTAYWMANSSAKKDVDSAWLSIDKQTDNTGVCASGIRPTACADLDSARDRMKSTATLSHAAFIAAGVLSTATIATYLLWPNTKEKREQRGAVVVAPYWMPGDQGIAARARF
ncbi:MAG TPA: PEGA domain-containing protein [Polyangiaceae bacterium]|nr:PEGA domain-containing protein [Polyangiaceae bacterium]